MPTDKRKTDFAIISLIAHDKMYYPASMERESWMPDNYVRHTDIEIPLGHSRYGGPVIDLPAGFERPAGLRFAAQLNLANVSPFDPTGLLPTTGHLFFFADIVNDIGKVIYDDSPGEKLKRHIDEHEDHFFTGVLINGVATDTENWMERFRAPQNEWEQDNLKHLLNDEGVFWDSFAGSDKSKIFGIFTHCQLEKDKIEEITFSDKVVLLQIGENGFNDVGVFSVLISKTDLARRNFDNCEFHWSQS